MEKKQQRIELKDEEARFNWREMNRMKREENQRPKNQLRDPKEKFEGEEE